MPKYPRQAWLQRDGHVQALVYSDQSVDMGDGLQGLPALVTDPSLNDGKPYLALIAMEELWTFVEPELVPEGAPKDGYLVYQEDDDQDVFVSLVFSEAEAHAYRRTDGYLGYVHIQLPNGSLEF
jgi:hypothetical protein